MNVIMDDCLQIAHNVSQTAATQKREMHVAQEILIYKIFFPLYF